MFSDWLTSGGFGSNKWMKRLEMIMDPETIPKRLWNKGVFKMLKKFMWR